MKKPDLFVQKIGSSFFDNDILPQSNSACAQKFFKRRCLRVARNASTHEQAHKILPQAPFHRRFLQRFLRKTRSVRILRREFTKRKRPNSAFPNFIPKIFARGAKREHARTGAQNSAPKLLSIEDFCRDFCARQEVCGFCDGNLQNVNDQAKTQARRGIAQKDRKNHSHSMVAGGFEVISYTTRFACFTSFTIRVEIFSRTS